MTGAFFGVVSGWSTTAFFLFFLRWTSALAQASLFFFFRNFPHCTFSYTPLSLPLLYSFFFYFFFLSFLFSFFLPRRRSISSSQCAMRHEPQRTRVTLPVGFEEACGCYLYLAEHSPTSTHNLQLQIGTFFARVAQVLLFHISHPI